MLRGSRSPQKAQTSCRIVDLHPLAALAAALCLIRAAELEKLVKEQAPGAAFVVNPDKASVGDCWNCKSVSRCIDVGQRGRKLEKQRRMPWPPRLPP